MSPWQEHKAARRAEAHGLVMRERTRQIAMGEIPPRSMFARPCARCGELCVTTFAEDRCGPCRLSRDEAARFRRRVGDPYAIPPMRLDQRG